MSRPATAYPPPGVYGRLWHNIAMDPALTAAERVCLSAAVRVADLATQPDDPRLEAPQRDQHWYRVALGAYHHLSTTSAYRLVDAGQARTPKPCRLDRAQARVWLTSPQGAAGERTVADTLGISDSLGVDDPELLAVIENLVRQAQDAGVFGVPGYRVHAHPVADVDTQPDTHIITLASTAGIALATNPIPPEQLIDDTLTGIDAALSALANMAAAVNGLRTGWIRIAAAAAPEARRTPTRRRTERAVTALDLAGPVRVSRHQHR